MGGVHPAKLNPQALLAACEVHRGRASGPGGQHRNKVETAIRIIHRPTGIEAAATERRSQVENHKAALLRLRMNLALQVRQPVAQDDNPTDLWRSRCRKGRIAINPQHTDFPAILAEVMDMIACCNFDAKLAAERLNCSTSQLTKLFKLDPRALALVNDARRRRNKTVLK